MALLDTVDITKLLLVEQGSTPSSPSAGKQKLFVRSSDHLLCIVDSAGTVTPYGGALTNPMTTAGDLIYGGASGTPTRLADVATGSSLISGGVGVAPSWGHPTLSRSSVDLASDQTIGSADTPTDITGCSLSLVTGTWLLLAYANFLINTAGGYGGLTICNNANTVFAEGFTRGATSALNQNAFCATLITNGSTTTWKIRAQMSGTTGKVTVDPLGVGGAGTRLIAVRLA